LDGKAAAKAAADGHHIWVAIMHHLEKCPGVVPHGRLGRLAGAPAVAPVVQGIDGAVGKGGCQFWQRGSDVCTSLQPNTLSVMQ
jgi:hypothetical protein